MELYLSRGNEKVKASIFSLPHRKSCPGSTPACRAFCYAQVAEYLYTDKEGNKTVLNCRINNMNASKQNDFSEKMTAAILKRWKNKIVRIHESGDFYSQEYINKWAQIARNCPEYTFFGFTRSWMFDLSKLQNLPNVHLRYSIDRTTKQVCAGFPLAVAEVENPGGFFACPGTASGDIKCMVDCKRCVETTENIFFSIHGSKKKKVHNFKITAKFV
jgi:hypothetical protein